MNPKRRRLISWTLRGALLALIGKGYANTWSGGIEVTRVEVPIPDLPPAFDGLRIAQLTDLHASAIVPDALLRAAAEAAMAEAPDLIVLTGDFISGATKIVGGEIGSFDDGHLESCLNALASLKAPLGLYGVLGNHDFWSGPPAVAAIERGFSEKLGLHWLRNRHQKIEKNGATLSLLGVDDYWEGVCSLPSALKGLPTDGVRVLLSHNPDINEEIELLGQRIDLVLSGHTHGGQVVAPLVGQPIMPSKFGQKYRVGLVRDGERQTFISRGVGHLLAPIRFNCPPEVAVLTLRAAPPQAPRNGPNS